MAVRFPAYRRFNASRVAANDAMMAILVGSRLASASIAEREASSSPTDLLPIVFPELPGVERLNRTLADARRLLADAERYLAYMAIPFALSVYGTYVVDVIRMAQSAGVADEIDVGGLRLSDLHPHLKDACSIVLPGIELELFDFLRRLRNRIIHYGGQQGSRLRQSFFDMSPEARELWFALTQREFPFGDRRDELVLGARELIPALSVTKHLGDAISIQISERLPKAFWATQAVEDYLTNAPFPSINRSDVLRKVQGIARYNYSSVDIGESDLESAIEVVRGRSQADEQETDDTVEV
jgi:hypothetical protein